MNPKPALARLPVIQSLLFVPGARPDRFDKALASGADVVCIDLEDAVPQAGKVGARNTAITALADAPGQAIRINAIRTRDGLVDLLALADARLHLRLLLLPMVENAAELAIVAGVLGPNCPPLAPLIETARGLRNAAAIHPAQRGAIHAGFRPSPAEIQEAEAAATAFAESGGAAVLFGGRMPGAPIMAHFNRKPDLKERLDA